MAYSSKIYKEMDKTCEEIVVLLSTQYYEGCITRGIKMGIDIFGNKCFTSSSGIYRTILGYAGLKEILIPAHLAINLNRIEMESMIQTMTFKIRDKVTEIKTIINSSYLANNLYNLLEGYNNKPDEFYIIKTILDGNFNINEIRLLVSKEELPKLILE